MHLTEEQIWKYTNGALEAAELLELDDHLVDCATCREKVANVLSANAGVAEAVNSLIEELTATGEEEFHLSFATLAASVDGQLGEVEQEIVTSHLQVCPACEAEFNDLQAFRQILAASEATTNPFPSAIPDDWREMLQNLRQLPVH